MKAALHRSLTFWFGLLVMGFVCWAWRDSLSEQTTLKGEGWMIIHCGNGASLGKISELGSKPITFDRRSLQPSSSSSRPFLVCPRLMRSTGDVQDALSKLEGRDTPLGVRRLSGHLAPALFGARGNWVAYIPHWIILLTVATFWLGLPFWRARQRRRAIPSAG